MSNAVTYYRTIIEVLDASAKVLMYRPLLDDLTLANTPNPDSYVIIVTKHKADLNLLRKKCDAAEKKYNNALATVRAMMVGRHLYDEQTDADWCAMIKRRKEDCDFRPMCRTWCSREIRRILDSGVEPEKVMSFGDLLKKYEDLVTQRQKKKGRKKK